MDESDQRGIETSVIGLHDQDGSNRMNRTNVVLKLNQRLVWPLVLFNWMNRTNVVLKLLLSSVLPTLRIRMNRTNVVLKQFPPYQDVV